MNEVSISIYFTLIITILMATPLIRNVLDKFLDISVLFNGIEEERKVGNGVAKQKSTPFSFVYNSTLSILRLQTKYHCLEKLVAYDLETKMIPPIIECNI